MLRTRDKRFAYGAAISAAVLIASLGIFVRNISADALIIAVARLSLGFMFLLGYLGLTRNLRVAKVPFSPYLVASGLSLGLCVWSYIKAIAHTSMANAVFLLYLGPLLAVGFACFLLREKIALPSILLMFLAFVGFLFVVQFDFSFSRTDAMGYAYGLLAAFTYALIIVTNRKIPAQVSTLGRSFYQLLIAALSLIPFLAGHNIHLSLQELPWLLALGFFPGFLGLTLMIFAIRHLTAYEYGILTYLEPVTATLVGVVIYTEPMSLLQTLGGSLIILSGLVQLWVAQPDQSQPTQHT